MATITYSAKAVAAAASKMLGRTVTDKQVRGEARGDTRAPVIGRVADDGYTHHAYSTAEYDRLMGAFAAREGKRTGKVPTWRHLSGKGAASPEAEAALSPTAHGTVPARVKSVKAVGSVNRALGQRAVRRPTTQTAPTAPETAAATDGGTATA